MKHTCDQWREFSVIMLAAMIAMLAGWMIGSAIKDGYLNRQAFHERQIQQSTVGEQK